MSRETIALPKEHRDVLRDVLPILNQRFSKTKNRLGTQPPRVISQFLFANRHAIQNGLLCDQDALEGLDAKNGGDRKENADADRTIPAVDYFFHFDDEVIDEQQMSEHCSVVRLHEILDTPEKDGDEE